MSLDWRLPWAGLITMGEYWHNNHHAFPGSAKIGLGKNQSDPGWWVLLLLEKVGLVWQIRLPKDLETREQVTPCALDSGQRRYLEPYVNQKIKP